MKLYKTIPNRILKKTNSTPEQLLKWFREIYKKHSDDCHPCIPMPYLGEYELYQALEGYGEISCGVDRYGRNVYRIWDYARESDENFNDIVNQFKKLYKISEAEQ